MGESGLKQAVARLQEALGVGDLRHGPDVYEVRGYDVNILFETLKRWGGRRDWSPTPDNIKQLPGPVRRYIYEQWAEIGRLQREAIDARAAARKAEAELAELAERRHPVR
jgi:hypothetical protein